ncbi:spore cortex-lytic enzyme [Jeotgalibacillus campisalis]|uniref:Spore cortex-lytic enzyme n=1 Tax=Jeotgalibacillus campisalis TaxID=220754 RepID=A0A0C2VGU2_9BACL|nr:spore cortex-lytic enzyme [Jeotgalibacillus campisalis]KIL48087.1 hypothetical protein KR50_22540 [Jeotgalibacillus campisalis]
MKRWGIIFVCLVVLQGVYLTTYSDAFSGQTIQRGAFGDDVIELQSRLQYIGYYEGQIDGDFGWGTYWALRNFQQDYGLDIDGLAGETTRTKLVNNTDYDDNYVRSNIEKGNRFTYYGGVPLDQQVTKEKSAPKKAPKYPSGYSENDIQLMANAVYGEARGEPYIGQVAVAAVILNRIEDEAFPNTASGVIFEPLAFTAVADGQIWLEPNEQAKEAVIDAINGWDPSENALYYFNPDTATSNWIWSRPQIKKIGEHIFCL